MEKPFVVRRLPFVVPMFSRLSSFRLRLLARTPAQPSTLNAERRAPSGLRGVRPFPLLPLGLLTALVLHPARAWAYPGQAVVEGSQVIFGTLAVLALIGMILASIFNRQYVREALYGLVATFVLFAVVRWAPQLVTLVQQ